MTVVGVDPHKRSHTAAAVRAITGELVGAKTVAARGNGHGELVRWARSLGEDVVFAVEDCRYVSGGLERFLLARAERVVQVSPKLMAGARQSGRERGKSDAIDAQAVARAALRHGPRACLVRISMAQRWRSSCCSTIARTWSRSARVRRTAFAGICTI